MLKLIKYEVRKSWLSKLILLIALGISEFVFLGGTFLTDPTKSPYTAIGIGMLVTCTVAGLSFVGIESILTLHKDLNTKQSYMLFMTPRNGYQILGAKIIENALTILIASLSFVVLAAVDIGILVTKIGGIKEAVQLIQQIFDVNIPWSEMGQMAALGFGTAVISWFAMIVCGYLAVILVASVLAGKKFSGFLAFVLFFVLTTLRERILNVIGDAFGAGFAQTKGFILYLILSLIFAGILYLVSCMMMEKKLSV